MSVRSLDTTSTVSIPQTKDSPTEAQKPAVPVPTTPHSHKKLAHLKEKTVSKLKAPKMEKSSCCSTWWHNSLEVANFTFGFLKTIVDQRDLFARRHKEDSWCRKLFVSLAVTLSALILAPIAIIESIARIALLPLACLIYLITFCNKHAKKLVLHLVRAPAIFYAAPLTMCNALLAPTRVSHPLNIGRFVNDE